MNEDTNNAVQCVIRLTRELETVRQETLDLFVAELEKEIDSWEKDIKASQDEQTSYEGAWHLALLEDWKNRIRQTADRLRGE